MLLTKHKPPCMHRIFSSTIAAIGKQLKQSVKVFQSLTLNLRLPVNERNLFIKKTIKLVDDAKVCRFKYTWINLQKGSEAAWEIYRKTLIYNNSQKCLKESLENSDNCGAEFKRRFFIHYWNTYHNPQTVGQFFLIFLLWLKWIQQKWSTMYKLYKWKMSFKSCSQMNRW